MLSLVESSKCHPSTGLKLIGLGEEQHGSWTILTFLAEGGDFWPVCNEYSYFVSKCCITCKVFNVLSRKVMWYWFGLLRIYNLPSTKNMKKKLPLFSLFLRTASCWLPRTHREAVWVWHVSSRPMVARDSCDSIFVAKHFIPERILVDVGDTITAIETLIRTGWTARHHSRLYDYSTHHAPHRTHSVATSCTESGVPLKTGGRAFAQGKRYKNENMRGRVKRPKPTFARTDHTV